MQTRHGFQAWGPRGGSDPSHRGPRNGDYATMSATHVWEHTAAWICWFPSWFNEIHMKWRFDLDIPATAWSQHLSVAPTLKTQTLAINIQSFRGWQLVYDCLMNNLKQQTTNAYTWASSPVSSTSPLATAFPRPFATWLSSEEENLMIITSVLPRYAAGRSRRTKKIQKGGTWERKNMLSIIPAKKWKYGASMKSRLNGNFMMSRMFEWLGLNNVISCRWNSSPNIHNIKFASTWAALLFPFFELHAFFCSTQRLESARGQNQEELLIPSRHTNST